MLHTLPNLLLYTFNVQDFSTHKIMFDLKVKVMHSQLSQQTSSRFGALSKVFVEDKQVIMMGRGV